MGSSAVTSNRGHECGRGDHLTRVSHSGKLMTRSCVRAGDREEVLLRRSLAQYVERLAELRIIRDRAAECRGVAEGEASNLLREPAVHERGRGVVLLAIRHDFRRFEPLVKLIAPLGLHREVFRDVILQLEGVRVPVSYTHLTLP